MGCRDDDEDAVVMQVNLLSGAHSNQNATIVCARARRFFCVSPSCLCHNQRKICSTMLLAGLRVVQSTLRSMVASTMEATPLQAASLLSIGAYMSLIGRHKLAVVTLVTGSSMFPTLPADGAVVLCNPLAVWRGELQPGTQRRACNPCDPSMLMHIIAGDVVMFQCMERCYLICKRIIALEGQTVTYVPPLATKHNAYPPPQRITVCAHQQQWQLC